MTTVEILQGMRDLCAKGWVRGASFEVNGMTGNGPVEWFLEARASNRPCACCAEGALRVVIRDQYHQVYPFIQSVLRRAYRETVSLVASIHAMNDGLADQEEALEWLDRAIRIAKEGGDG